MAPLSRLLVPALLRPLGEHLLDMLEPQPDDTCLVLGDDLEVMSHLLAPRTRRCLRADPGQPLPQADGSVQVATSLLAPLGAADLAELHRVLDPQKGRLACLTRVALPGVKPLGTTPADTPLRAEEIRDVARFDSPEQLHAAIEGPVDEAALQPYAGYDGTLRIPLTATVLRLP